MRQLLVQILKFGAVGGICFFLDYGLLAFATECLGLHYLISGFISFTVSVTVNYLLSRKFVFAMGQMETHKEFILFVILSVIGLGINEACMAVLVELAGVHYLISKIAATAIVMVYNFISRKMLMENKDGNIAEENASCCRGKEKQ
ncbi:GtrA family protein [Clostridium sp. AF19-22AC]|jgi:putative flippase GtrA|uniref:GtrA family protein n=1 Tax=Clostridia TaxID=186801 RepID=UPI000E4B8707|nr:MULTISPECIES: GtrA family protein [Clostridia]RHR25826.1 GtrA family protein [Clostridium sp. AF19-22AC]